MLDPRTGEAQAADLGYVSDAPAVKREAEEEWGQMTRTHSLKRERWGEK